MPARTAAKPPDLPMNETITVAPKTAPVVEPSAETIYEALPASVPTPALYELRPTARRTLVGSMLLGINPMLGWLPTEKALDAPHDHPQRVAGDDIFCNFPKAPVIGVWSSGRSTIYYGEGDWLKWLVTHWAARHQVPAPQQNEGYLSGIAWGMDKETPAEESEAPPALAPELLPMPKEEPATDGITCPYLRQQRMDRHACQLADPEIGRDVLANLERLQQSDDLLELAAKLIRDGYIIEAMECCALVADLCPGSPCADRAACMMLDLCLGLRESMVTTEEAEAKTEECQTKPGVEQQVDGLMKACRLLMNEGLHERAAELARQAYALDPERVMADPLIYKMHLLADTPAKQPFGSTHPAGKSEESEEPATCPYCPSSGKPIQGILKQKKESKSGPTTLLVPALPPIEYEVVPTLDRVLTESAKTAPAAGAEEASEEEQPSGLPDLIESMMGSVGVRADGARLSCEWSCGGNVYHLRYGCGCLAIWKTPDASKSKP
jgi:hypothetical protein